MHARVFVSLKRSVLDPQGKAVRGALETLGLKGIEDVRQGKFFDLELADGDPAERGRELDSLCQKLLANPVIEDYRIEWVT
ncbi:MAG: phosphoribosylformylglycinamidine synthase subunit PurS [Candidatus Omnitrophica bacterium]|nr:phosphoribosylformylglycinamidine synthase subunit PurS [Candidatus Omnitrophota bacterium]